MKSIKLALTIMSSQSHVEQTGRGVLENCMVTILLSLAMVCTSLNQLTYITHSLYSYPHKVPSTAKYFCSITLGLDLLNFSCGNAPNGIKNRPSNHRTFYFTSSIINELFWSLFVQWPYVHKLFTFSTSF